MALKFHEVWWILQVEVQHKSGCPHEVWWILQVEVQHNLVAGSGCSVTSIGRATCLAMLKNRFGVWYTPTFENCEVNSYF